ncbi:MAG: ankyrin repeat domain-containing protein [Akkermansia sp.]|nr:ankyrin repeat domain-containing protein [Akkermansia sp.]
MSKTTSSPNKKLHVACIDGSLKGVQKAIKAGADINAVEPEEGSALFVACREGHSHIVEYLLEQPGIDIMQGGYDTSSQILAGDVQVLGGVSCEPIVDLSRVPLTPLSIAVSRGYRDIVAMLLEHNDSCKYLGLEWEGVIAQACEPDSGIHCLDLLIDAADYDRELLVFTFQHIFKHFRYYNKSSVQKLAAVFKQFSAEVQVLVLGSFATNILRYVKESRWWYLAHCLNTSDYFCSRERLRPYLLSALKLARQLRREHCEETLLEALENPKGVEVFL